MNLIEKLFFSCLLSFIGYLKVINCACEQDSISYCSFLKRIDIAKLELDDLLRINLSNEKYAKLEYEKLSNAKIKNEIVYAREIHSRKETLIDLDSLAANFIFKYIQNEENELELILSFKFSSKDELILTLKDKTLKFKLTTNINENVSAQNQSNNLICALIVDFYDRDDIGSINLPNGFNSNNQFSNIDHQQLSFIYYEATYKDNKFFITNEQETTNAEKSSHQIEIDLKTVINRWCNESYSILCLKCNSNFTLIMSNDVLKIKAVHSNQAALLKFNDIFQDIMIMVAQQNQHYSYLNIRIYFDDRTSKEEKSEHENTNENFNSDEETSLIREKRYLSKKYQSNNSSSALSGSKIHHLNSNYNGYNVLKPAQLVITEETIGLQTKLKIYEHVWIDYQLNASDYVKQRIQLIAPDNPILNITRPFDYEFGGPMHSFQIIFTRKSDKRSSKTFSKKDLIRFCV
jgi:hypothetical protein